MFQAPLFDHWYWNVVDAQLQIRKEKKKKTTEIRLEKKLSHMHTK